MLAVAAAMASKDDTRFVYGEAIADRGTEVEQWRRTCFGPSI